MATDNKPKIQLDPQGKTFIDNETNRQSLSERDMSNKSKTQDVLKNELKNEKKSPSQKKIDLLNKFREILKTAGADSQQNYKAVAQLDKLLFNDKDELDYDGQEEEVVPETGNEPAGTRNPNVAVPDPNTEQKVDK